MRDQNKNSQIDRRRARSASAGLLGLGVLGLTVFAAAPASASDPWRYDETRNGAFAQSCGGTGAYTGCATLTCGPDGVMQFTLEDLTPGAPISRDGRVTSPGYSDKVKWNRIPGSRRGGQDYLAAGLNIAAMIDFLKRNASLGVVINDRISRKRGEMYFTLQGSGRAITRLENSCARLADLNDRGRPGGRPGGLPGGRPGGRPGGPDDWRPTAPETSPWRYSTFRGGAMAQSCGTFAGGRGEGREICATLFCTRSTGLAFGLDGLVETPDWNYRDGVISVGRAATKVRFDLAEGPRRGEQIFVASHPRPDRLAERLQKGDELEVTVQPRDEPVIFGLDNSNRAIARLRERCDRLADVRDDRYERDEDLVTERYREDVVGRWAADRRDCRRGGGWNFDLRRIETPDGAACDRVQVAEVGSGPLTGGVAIRGSQCSGGDPRQRGEARVFETMREGGDLVLRSVNAGNEVRIGERLVFKLEPRSHIVKLQRCGR